MKIQIDIQKSGQKTLRGELGTQPLLDQVFEAGGFERFAGSASCQQLRSIEIDEDRQAKSPDLRTQAPLGGRKPSIEATVPICTPLTLTGAPTFSPLRLPWNMQMKVIGLVKIQPEPTTIRATTRIAKLATTNAPIAAGLTRLLMAGYWSPPFLSGQRNSRNFCWRLVKMPASYLV